MIPLQKTPDKDFIVMNITDPQLGNEGWGEAHPNRMVFMRTLTALVERVQPDLITVSGDLALPGHTDAYRKIADYLDSFKIPWAPIWGNHDNEMGSEYIDSIADEYLTHPYCVYEKGPANLGNGNYVIAIEEAGTVVEGLIMMDSHNRDFIRNDKNEICSVDAKLYPEQLIWYREQIEALQKRGCSDTTIILHIPIFAYRTAFEHAFCSAFIPSQVSVKESYCGKCWNAGYENSYGVCYENGIACYPADDGVFNYVKNLNSTKTILAGHDHVNNFVIQYEGISLVYGTKTGIGSYWNKDLNGGTVLTVSSKGVCGIRHEYAKIRFDYKMI